MHRWVVNEHFPKGSWEAFAERKFTHAVVDNKQLNRVVASTEEHFTADTLYTTENNRRLMLWYDDFTICLHQLLTPKNIDQGIVDRLKQTVSTVSIPTLSPAIAKKPSPLLSTEISEYCEKMSSPSASDKRSAHWSSKTLLDFRSHLDTFCEIIHAITHKPVTGW